jgi:hypothetical protein
MYGANTNAGVGGALAYTGVAESWPWWVLGGVTLVFAGIALIQLTRRTKGKPRP